MAKGGTNKARAARDATRDAARLARELDRAIDLLIERDLMLGQANLAAVEAREELRLAEKANDSLWRRLNGFPLAA